MNARIPFLTALAWTFLLHAGLSGESGQAGSVSDPSPHSVRCVDVTPDLRLATLDWGGRVQTLVFLAGLGNTAHVFDQFAPLFTDEYRVIGVTRRGFGASSRPTTGYDASQLGEDVLTVLDRLAITAPV